MNDCSTCNSSLSDICYYVKITCSIKFQRGGHRFFMVFQAGAYHSLRSCLVLAGFARSCLALSPLRGEMTFITRCPDGKKPKDKSQERLLCRLVDLEIERSEEMRAVLEFCPPSIWMSFECR